MGGSRVPWLGSTSYDNLKVEAQWAGS